MRRKALRASLAAAVIAVSALGWSSSAQAAFPATVFGNTLTCTAPPAQSNVRLCAGEVPTFDGTSIDVNVILPPAPPSGPDGPYPAIGYFHGWGGSKLGLNANPPSGDRVESWATNGYAVFSMSDRGWGNSCGGQDADRFDPTKCAKGYNHLMDTRYEVRDAQYFFGRLADDGAIIPNKIASTGGSYGGGISMALAALKDRTMLPDGSLVPWTSPGNNTPMSLAVAAPEIPWTDLANSLMPNGHTLDYVADSPYLKRGRVGVEKQSFVAGLNALGTAFSNYAPPGTDPTADISTWFALINAGEPYDQNPQTQSIVNEITNFHSSYYIDHSEAPAPLLISNGWTDDLFPPDEAIRFYNRTRTDYPGAKVGLQFMDFGHQRGQNKPAERTQLDAREDAWFSYYLKGAGSQPPDDVEVFSTTCGGPSSGPFSAPTWAQLPAGEIRLDSPAPQTIASAAGDPSRNQAYDPIAGGGACATTSGTDQSGAASYRLPAAPAGGFTVMGSPTVVADIENPGPFSQLSARLVDIDQSTGNATLIARGVYRPELNPAGAGPTRQVFQLHPNTYRVAQNHILKLELLPNDTPYDRTSNAQTPITVSNLQLRLPVQEAPANLGGGIVVQSPAQKVVPSGYRLADDFLPRLPGDDDGDGVPNSSDNCPAAPGPASNNGCPTIGADADKDGIPDSQDLCPTTPGVVTNAGCPAGSQAQNPAPNPAQAPTVAKCNKKKKSKHRRSASAAKKKKKKHCGKKKKRHRQG